MGARRQRAQRDQLHRVRARGYADVHAGSAPAANPCAPLNDARFAAPATAPVAAHAANAPFSLSKARLTRASGAIRCRVLCSAGRQMRSPHTCAILQVPTNDMAETTVM